MNEGDGLSEDRQPAVGHEKSRLLCMGHDPLLNRTRKLIFEKCFDVTLASALEEAVSLLAEQRFDLVLLCYSLTDEECRWAVECIHGFPHPPRILVLTQGGDRLLLGPHDERFASTGPADLLQKAASMAGIASGDGVRCPPTKTAPQAATGKVPESTGPGNLPE